MNYLRLTHSVILLLSLFLSTQAQDTRCECCSYSSLKFREDYEAIFPRLVIKKKGITEVMVYTSPSDSGQKADAHYKEMKFKFDQKGQVIARVHYNENGQPHSIYEFERNGSGKIFRQTFSYLDSAEQKSSISASEITDYFYNLKEKLIKTKKRNAHGQVMPDIMSDFTKYEYDKIGRIIKVTTQYYNEGKGPTTSSQVVIYTYKDINGQSQTYIDGKLFLTTKTQYTKGWKPLTETGYDGKAIAFESKYEYDQTGKPVRYETKGTYKGCPENGTFTDVYSYDGDGLLNILSHTYDDKKCVMVLEYSTPAASNQPSSRL